MLVQNTVVNLKWELKATPNFANYNNINSFDLQITKPDGSVTYMEGGNWIGTAPTFSAPEETVNGLISYNYTFDQVGVYTLILGVGSSTSFDILSTRIELIVEQDTENTEIVYLP